MITFDQFTESIKIQELDVIKYDFKLSPANKVVSKLSMEWGKNYGSNKYTRFYDANQTRYSYTNTSMDSEYATPSKNFSGIEDEDDNHKTICLLSTIIQHINITRCHH